MPIKGISGQKKKTQLDKTRPDIKRKPDNTVFHHYMFTLELRITKF